MKDKRFLVAMVLIVALIGFAFLSGYAAGREGENRNLVGAIYVALGVISFIAGLVWIYFMWKKNTDAPAGVSGWRYLLGALGGFILGSIMLAFFVHEAKPSNSFSLGMVMAVTICGCYGIWQLIASSMPSAQLHDENGSISFFEKEEVNS